jgi:hypothetical protein
MRRCRSLAEAMLTLEEHMKELKTLRDWPRAPVN